MDFSTIVRGSVSLDREQEVLGLIDGDVNVLENGSLLLHGMINGNVTIAQGGKATVNGIVNGSIHNDGTLTVNGMVKKGCTTGDTGQSYISDGALISGMQAES